MKKKSVVRNGIYILLLNIFLCSVSIAQLKSEEKNDYDCDHQPLGMFRQVIKNNVDYSQIGAYPIPFFLSKESDLQEKRYTLEPLDEVVPIYKIDVLRGTPKPSSKNRCDATINVRGKLISPSGKWFEFKEATYNFPLHILKFTTVERDGITYEVEAKFSVKPLAKMELIEDAYVKLKASGKDFGIILMKFKIR